MAGCDTGPMEPDPPDALLARATPDDIDLARRRTDLARAERALAEQTAAWAAYEHALAAFQRRYLTVLGPIITELEALEAAIAERAAQARPEDNAKRNKAERARARLEPRDAAPAPAPKPAPTDELRTIFRALTKQIHPDLADDEAERRRREALMVKANAAYAAGDMQALAWLQAQQAPGPAAEDPLAAIARRLALASEQLARGEARRQAAEDTPLARLMRRAAKAEADGRDLFRKLAAELEDEAQRARKRLRQLTRRAEKRGR